MTALPLNLRRYGERGTPIVLLHGLFGSAANWGSSARALADEYRVLVPDLRNHGQSPHDDDVSYTAMRGDLLRLLDEQGLDRVLLVGHSMGGKLAMHLALSEPQRVSGLAVVDMAPVAYRHRFDTVLDAFDAVQLDTLEGRSDADRQMAGAIDQPGLRAFLLQNLVRDDDGWQWRHNLAALRRGQDRITGFDPPGNAVYDGVAWFIHGELSDYLLPEHLPQVQRLFPQARICPVAGAGHWVYAEQPQGFAECLNGFLQAATERA